MTEMMKEGLLGEDALKAMSADIVGMIAGYEPMPLSALTPTQRLQLADRCFAKDAKTA